MAEQADPARVYEAVRDLLWKATQYGETDDGDTASYLLPKGTVHRLVGAMQAIGQSAPLRNPLTAMIANAIDCPCDKCAAPVGGRLAEIQQRAEAATAGPWTAEYSALTGHCVIPHDAESTREAVALTRLHRAQGDAEFIAHARADIPWLLTELAAAPVGGQAEPSDAQIELRSAVRGVSAALVAHSHLLLTPFTDAPDLTPWSLYFVPAMARLRDAVTAVISGGER